MGRRSEAARTGKGSGRDGLPRPPLAPAQGARLRDALGRWFAEQGRDLPWRRTRDPYAVWISEAMLQQTRIETVIPYWHRFLERFPTVADLARAEETELLAAWSGLGYYRRARSLNAAARSIVEQHGGRMPRERSEMLSLPGIGPYTAGAVLSIAFDLPEPLVDGNVARVFSRLFGLDDPLDSAVLKSRLWELAGALVPAAGEDPGPGAWNQALMDLGATVCVPREPRCDDCPLAGECEARREGRTAELPVRARKPEPIDVRLRILLVERGAELLLHRRGRDGRMAGLLEFPTCELAAGATGSAPEQAPRLYDWTLPGAKAGEAGLGYRLGEQLGEIRHGITRHRIRAEVCRGELAPARGPAGRAEWKGDAGPDGLRWIPRQELGRLGLTGMTRKVLRRFGGGDG